MKHFLKINPRVIRTTALVLVLAFVLSGCVSSESYEMPADEGGILSIVFVRSVAWVLFHITEFFGGSLVIGIILTTLLIRTLAWPIYAKGTNSMAQTQDIQPEIQRIQAKYAGKNDTASQQKMSAEIRQAYKDGGVNMLGCLLPFMQMPIFLVVYSAIIRFPNNIIAGTNTVEFMGQTLEINPDFLGMNILTEVSTGFSNGNYIYAIIPILVALSMFLVQYSSQKRTNKAHSDIPEYRRNPQAESTAKQMKYMMYGFTIMMGVFTITAPVLLGIYWTIGNLYSLVQSTITNRQRDKKRAKA